jgi:hypothetical protein
MRKSFADLVHLLQGISQLYLLGLRHHSYELVNSICLVSVTRRAGGQAAQTAKTVY